MSVQRNRADKDFKGVEKDAELDEVIIRFNELVKGINYTNKFLSIQSNFDGYIATDVSLPANPTGTSTVKIQHFLGVIPKWRIILRQTGNGVITDVSEEWTDKVISLKNNSTTENVVISVFIARE
jgi:hypothetical protein